MSKRRVSYYYDRKFVALLIRRHSVDHVLADVGAYTYGLGHPMKPQRMRITHELVSAYEMLPKMNVLVGACYTFVKAR